MKKLFTTCLFLFGVLSLSLGQAPLGESNKQLNAGFGLSSWGVPIYIGLDFGVHPDITVGPQLSYRNYSESYRDINGTKYSYGHSIFVIGFNGNYHFNSLLDISSNFDFYAGLTLAYYIWSSPSGYLGAQGTGIGLNGQIGGRYFISDRFGLNLEFGGGTATGGRFGITYLL